MSREIEHVSTALEGIVADLAPSVVSIHSHRLQTSGFVWRPGLIVTSDEGLAEEGEVQATLPGGDRVAVQVVGRDASTAIAVLKVERPDLRPVALAAPFLRREGSWLPSARKPGRRPQLWERFPSAGGLGSRCAAAK